MTFTFIQQRTDPKEYILWNYSNLVTLNLHDFPGPLLIKLDKYVYFFCNFSCWSFTQMKIGACITCFISCSSSFSVYSVQFTITAVMDLNVTSILYKAPNTLNNFGNFEKMKTTSIKMTSIMTLIARSVYKNIFLSDYT